MVGVGLKNQSFNVFLSVLHAPKTSTVFWSLCCTGVSYTHTMAMMTNVGRCKRQIPLS